MTAERYTGEELGSDTSFIRKIVYKKKERFSMAYPKPLSEKALQRLYKESGLDTRAQGFLHDFFAACANLYGAIELRDAWDVYQQISEDKPKLRRKDLVAFSAITRREEQPYYVFETEEVYSEENHNELSRLIVSKDLLRGGYGKFIWLYKVMEQAVNYPPCVPIDFLSYASPKPEKEETELLHFLGRLKVTADVWKNRAGKEYPCEHKGKRLREFSFLNSDERFEVEYLQKRPKQQAAFLADCAGTEAEKIVRRLREEDNIGYFSPAESVQHVTEELSEVGVELTFQQAQELTRLMMEFHNHSRHWCICGWKPVELAQRYKLQGKPSISFGPGMQKAFANGDMDREEMVRQLRAMGLTVEE